jgi:hypothetical protein
MRSLMIPALIVAAFIFLSSPAGAQQSPDAGAWKLDGDHTILIPAKIALPASAGVLALTRTSESSQNGKGVDDVAQYESDDRQIFGTAFVFFASYADTALASIGTDRAIRQRYGPAVTLDKEGLVAVGGVADAAIRQLYEKGELEPGKPLTSVAGYIRAGRWIIVLRVSGPAARRADVEAGFDALVAGLRFDGKDKPLAAKLPTFAAPCPAADERAAKPMGKSKDSGANALIASLLGGAVTPEDENSKEPAALAFPRNGASAMCVRGKVRAGDQMLDLLQPASPDDGTTLLVQLDDAGGVLAVEPLLIGGGYQVKHYGIGMVQVLGSFRTLPTAAQLGAILDGSDRVGSAIQSTTIFKPNGNSDIQIDMKALK